MSERGLRWKKWNLYILFAGAAHFALFYTLNTRPMLNYVSFEAGTEQIPFQYRALTAWILRVADRLFHIPAALARHLPPSMNSVSEFTVLLITFVSMVAAYFAIRSALMRLTDGDAVWSYWGALLVIPMCCYHYLLEFGHPCCTPMQLPYDLPSVAFFAGGIAVIVAESFWWLYPLFAVSTLNRESTLFLIVLLLLYRSGQLTCAELRARRGLLLVMHCVLLCAVWMTLRMLVHHLFPYAAAGTGTHVAGFEIHVIDNIGYIFRPYYWTSFLSMFGFTWLFVYLHWHDVPGKALRRALWIGPIYLLAMYVVGVLSEIRIFGELIALFVIAFTMLLRKLLQDRPVIAIEATVT